MFSCCSRYLECSKKGNCINEIKGLKEECLYRTKLESGINYYKEKSIKEDKTYILIDNRVLYIGKREGYKQNTYRLSEEEREELRQDLKGTDIKITDSIKNKCIDEVVTDYEMACSKVILTINDNKKYNIYNYNLRGLKERTSSSIRECLIKNDLLAAIEVVGTTQPKISKPAAVKIFNKEVIVNKKLEEEQISLFHAM